MSAFDTYFMMQADNLCAMIMGVGIIAAAVGGLMAAVGAGVLADNYSPSDGKSARAVLKTGLTGLAIGLVCFVGYAFTPNSKTVAAMYLVPALTQNETIQGDLEDVYALGMERLKELLTEEKEATK